MATYKNCIRCNLVYSFNLDEYLHNKYDYGLCERCNRIKIILENSEIKQIGIINIFREHSGIKQKYIVDFYKIDAEEVNLWVYKMENNGIIIHRRIKNAVELKEVDHQFFPFSIPEYMVYEQYPEENREKYGC